MDGDMDYDMEDDDEYGSQYDMGMTGMSGLGAGAPRGAELAKKKKKKKKKKRKKTVEFEDPSLREHLLAGAYGGVAKAKPKRQGIKYTTDINAGLRDIATPGSAFHRDNSRKNMMMQGPAGNAGADSSRGRGHHGRQRSSYGRSEGGSNHGSRLGSKVGSTQNRVGQQSSTSKLMDP
jgi:hypothetical protein